MYLCVHVHISMLASPTVLNGNSVYSRLRKQTVENLHDSRLQSKLSAHRNLLEFSLYFPAAVLSAIVSTNLSLFIYDFSFSKLKQF